MTFGKRPPLQDRSIVFKATPHDTYAKNIQQYMKECYSNAIAIQSASQERARKYYEDKRRNELFEVGDQVFLKAPSRSSKFAPKFIGPYRIIETKKDIYTLKDVKTGRKTSRHVNDIRKMYRPQDEEVACGDDS